MRFAFISTMSGHPWGGSEELWSGAARRLQTEGHAVAACIGGWASPRSQVDALRSAGIQVWERPHLAVSIASRIAERLRNPLAGDYLSARSARWLRRQQPDLVCISQGNVADGIAFMKVCGQLDIGYVIVSQANAEFFWPWDSAADELAGGYRAARAAFFVSERNRELLCDQLGMSLFNTEIVRNPFNVAWDAAPPWPAMSGGWRLACVARLEPPAKGQDLLFRLLAGMEWRERSLRVSLFGSGPMERSLRRLAERFELRDRVRFCGHVQDVAAIWAEHHALILPSRYEGLPLASVEAMLCGRLAIVTDVAGNAEMIQDGISGFVAASATHRALSEAAERAWERRREWRDMGEAARTSIRECIPRDPVGEFARRLVELAGSRVRRTA